MSSEIKLEHPYSERWRKGYLVVNPEGRKTLILYNSSKDRSSTQYARYLLAVKLGRYLHEDETVDHIDDDIENDDISNLEALSQADNTRKAIYKKYPKDHSHLKHGTLSMYRYCKCDLCKECNRNYFRLYKK